MEISQGSRFMVLGVNRYKSLSALQMVLWMVAPWNCYLEAWQHRLQSGESQLAFLCFIYLFFFAFYSLIDGLKVIMCQCLGSNRPILPQQALVRVPGWLAVFFDIQVNKYLLRLYSMQDTWLGRVRDRAMV